MPKKQRSRDWQIQWTEEGIDSLWEGWAFIASRSEEQADRMVEAAQRKVGNLQEHPYLGPVAPELEGEPLEYRQLVLSPWPYRAIYRVEEALETIWILRIHPTKMPLEEWLED
mgnify:CR=1 FL=1